MFDILQYIAIFTLLFDLFMVTSTSANHVHAIHAQPLPAPVRRANWYIVTLQVSKRCATGIT